MKNKYLYFVQHSGMSKIKTVGFWHLYLLTQEVGWCYVAILSEIW